MSRPGDPSGESPAPPYLKAMLICDHAIKEEGTGKISLIGIFENIACQNFPSVHASLTVYVKVADAQGDYDLALELVRMEDMMVVGRGQVKASVLDRLEPAEWIFNLGWLRFEQPGRYEFRLAANGRHIESKSFNVLQSTQIPEA